VYREAPSTQSGVYRSAKPFKNIGNRSAGRTNSDSSHSIEQHHDGLVHSACAAEPDAGHSSDSNRDRGKYWNHGNGTRSQHKDADYGAPRSDGESLFQFLRRLALPAVSSGIRAEDSGIGW